MSAVLFDPDAAAIFAFASAFIAVLATITCLSVAYYKAANPDRPTSPPKPKAPTCCHCGRDLKPMYADEVFVSSLHHVAPAGATHYCDNHTPSRFFTERRKPEPPPELREL